MPKIDLAVIQDAIRAENNRSLVKLEDCNALGGVVMSQLVADEVQIMMLATARRFRRQGIATKLLQALLDRCGYVALSTWRSEWGELSRSWCEQHRSRAHAGQ
jgi:ribosomal protein S18 acetylase RimI-like enzyme